MIDEILSTLSSSFNINLNKQQREYVVHKDGPSITLAVPGAGKTTSLVVRLYVLIKYYEVNPKNILVMTFSRASAKDMESRFKTLFGENYAKGITFSTIHSFALSVIKNYQRYKGVAFQIIEGDKSPVNKIRVLKQIYKEANNEFINDDQLDEMCNSIGYMKNAMIPMSAIDKCKFSTKNFEQIYETYENYKKSNNYIDFDDMLTLSYDILKNNEGLLKFYRNTYKYILLDEGQDTSPVQHEIVRLISYPHNNLSLIGDDDQTIFGFRGASPDKLLQFKDVYAGAKVYFMEQNYRSTNNIVVLADSFIKINKERYNKNLFTERDTGNPVSIVNVLDEKSQAKYIVEEIKQLQSYNSVAVLFRNNISSVILADEFDKSDIPFYTKDSKLYLFNHWVALDIIAFMKLSLDKMDMESFERIYFKMGAYLSKKVIEYIKSEVSYKSIWDVLLNCPFLISKQIEKVRELKIRFENLSKKSPKDAIDYIYGNIGYKDYLKKNEEESGYSFDNLGNIVDILSSISQDIKDIPSFFDRLNALQNKVEYSKFNKGKGVTLSTIHSSKGLEYDTVYMVDLIDGEFPSYSSISKSEREKNATFIEEEARLFYVGLTRAKNNLCLFELENRYGKKTVPSRFLNKVKSIVNPKCVKVQRTTPNTNNNVEIKVGQCIIHSNFGEGKVLSLENGVLEIDFKTRGIKKLMLSFCLDGDMLRVVE